MNTQPQGTIASAVTTPNKLNKKRKIGSNLGNVLTAALNAPRMSGGFGDFGGKATGPNSGFFRGDTTGPNRVVTDRQPINVPGLQPVAQVQPQQPLQQNTQTNLPFGGVSQLQASPQAFMSFLRQFNTR